MVEIRYLLPEDNLLEISGVYEKSWKYAYKGILPQSYLDSIPEGCWEDNIHKNGWKNLIMAEDGKIIGTSCFGRRLLKAAMDELGKRGFRDILLWVLEENKRARSFYEKNGFTHSKEYRDDMIGGKKVREVMYLYKKE